MPTTLLVWAGSTYKSVREFVDACREFGLRIGFYSSLMDWHHPDGWRCAFDSQARQRFMKDHGTVFWVMGVMQWFWYGSDRRRERFVKICEDKDVQQLTFDSYMNKQLTRQRPMAHVRIFFKDLAHLLGLARV